MTLLYRAVHAPSTGITTPVTKEAASDDSQITPSAISSACPIRPIGCTASAALRWRLSAGRLRATIGVRINPGATALTRILALAYSNAPLRVSCATPPLAALYAAIPVVATRPIIDEV